MIVYRQGERTIRTQDALSACTAELALLARRRICDPDAATEVLIAFGEIWSAVADALFPEFDDLAPFAERAAEAGVAIARMFRACLRSDRIASASCARAAMQAIEALPARDLPCEVHIRVPEGFAYYALYPETYLKAAARLADVEDTGPAVVIGLRSIGATLAALVAAELEARGWTMKTLTIRPRGHPFDRRPVFGRDLRRFVGEHADAAFLVVDEGPGLSGTSFCGTADLLSELGVGDDRIVLFPSWWPQPDAFVSDHAKSRWPRHRIMHVPFGEVVGGVNADLLGARELSAGAWREELYGWAQDWPAAQPAHERRKYLRPDGAGGGQLLKFAGLGRYGTQRRALGEKLGDAGFAPQVLGLSRGFLVTAFAPGRPLQRADFDGDLAGFVCRYLTGRAGLAASTEPRVDELLAMTETNIRLGLGPDWLGALRRVRRLRPILESAPAVAVDGRMLPHEFLQTNAGFLKTDGLDHHDDHFFPGQCDLAWDVAGFAAEFGLPSAPAGLFAETVAHATNDRGLLQRLPFYAVAYPAFRLGYATLAAQTLQGSEDGRRFKLLKRRYAERLRLALHALEVQ